MLAMPHDNDDGHLRCDVLVEIGWLQHQLAGLAHQSQILSNSNSCRVTDPARPKELVKGAHTVSATSLDLVLTRFDNGQDRTRERQALDQGWACPCR